VLVDFSENQKQIEKFILGKYSTNGLISRSKKYLPNDIIQWYGHLSANFAHYGPLHSALLLPNICHANNWVLVIGLRNIVRAVVTLHIVMERLYFDQTSQPLLWMRLEGKPDLIFNENSQVFVWAEELGKEIVAKYPPNERKDGFSYDEKGVSCK
jgi:hypothetical protein